MIPAIGNSLPRIETGLVQGGLSTGLSTGASAAAGQQDFATVMAQIAGDAVGAMKNAEAVSVKGINGQASTQAVVDAVMNAERTLNTAVAVRDKVVAAYQELSRMAI